MSVEDWARREAEGAFDGTHIFTAHGFHLGIVHAFSALLSDEAVEELAEHLYDSQTATTGKYQTSFFKERWGSVARAALQAAVDAVTKGDTE